MRALQFVLMVLFIGSFVACGQSTKGVKDAKGLPVGTTAPLFNALDADSTAFRLSDALATGPVVLIFYRGYLVSCMQQASQSNPGQPEINHR